MLQFDWYPDYYFIAAVGASYYDIIVGQGYIVVIDNEDYEDCFFEAFIRGTLKIPSAIPVVGGLAGQLILAEQRKSGVP